MKNENVNFPLSLTGHWHNGVHIINDEVVIQKYLSFVCAIRNSEFSLDKYKELYELISKSDYDLLSDEEKEMYSVMNGNSCYKLKTPQEKSIIKQILKKINLYSSPEFILFQHNFFNNKNSEKLKFFSLYMHLDQILNSKPLKDIEYSNTNNPKILFPHTNFATAGISEKDDVIYQIEYFMDKKNVQEFFTNNQLLISGNECYTIDGEVQLFSLNSQTEVTKRSYIKNTIFEVTEFPNEEKFPNIARVKPYLLPCVINKDNNSLQLKKETEINLKSLLNINFFKLNSQIKISYLLYNDFISNSQVDFINKYHYIKIESINNIKYQKEISLRDLICGFDFQELSEFKICYINNQSLNFDDNEFYVDLNTSPFKEVFFDKRRMLLLTKDIDLETMKYNPYLYEVIAKNKIDIDNLKIPCNKIYFNNKKVKYDINEKAYYYYSDNLYYCLDTKKDVYISPKDYFTFVSYDDLKIVETETENQKKKEKLREIFDEKSKEKNKSYKEGAFEHPSEWHNDDSAYSRLGIKEKYIKKNLAIWDKNYSNTSFPDEIKDCSNLTFFHKSQFETFLSRLHKTYAEKLIKVQDMVMHKFSYKQGNLGLYETVFGFKSQNSQPFCNHAVFETIKKVDGNYLSILLNIDEPAWDLRKYKKNIQFVNFLKKNNCLENDKYKFKESNLWFDILDYQSTKTMETGIAKITSEQAFYMAQLGYVVIAAWKNTSKNGRPHFVTVRPCEEEYRNMNSLKVAHVGGGKNSIINIFKAFDTSVNDNKISEIKYYCNIKQSFI